MHRMIVVLLGNLLICPSCSKDEGMSQTDGLAARCVPRQPVPAALLECRSWITFAPPRPFNPVSGVPASETLLRESLQQLVREGWRGLVTYSLDSLQGLEKIPRLAKEVGFTSVICGLFWYDTVQLRREWAAALRETTHIDGYVLGNEGLEFGRYTRSDLERELARLRSITRRPVTTSEPLNQYENDSTLLLVGDWVFPNLHPFLSNIRDTQQAAEFVLRKVQELQARAPGRTIVVKECWWPTAGDAGASETNQTAFFRQLSTTTVWFVWGEAYDQYWKTAEGPFGPHWGLHTDAATPKALIEALKATYTGPY